MPIIENPAGDKKLPKAILDGILHSRLPSKTYQMMDGLLVPKPRKTSEIAPIRAVGSAVGAPVIHRGERVGPPVPKTRRPIGGLMPIGQN